MDLKRLSSFIFSRRRFKSSAQRGIALITTLLITALLVSVIVEFNRTAIADISVSTNFLDQKKILYTSISGVNAIKELLRLDARYTKHDTLFEKWAQGSDYFNAASSFLDEGSVTGRIQDEDGRICVNSLLGDNGSFSDVQYGRWERLLNQSDFKLSPEDVYAIIYGVKDWLDADDEQEGIYGAENSFYEQKGYRCKNGPMDKIEEMLLVKGVTKSIFYGDKSRKGIGEFFTVYGGSSININTAPVPVLIALSERMTWGIAQEMDYYRREPTNVVELGDLTWYRRLWPYEKPLDEKYLKTNSSYFTLRLKGTFGESTRNILAVIARSDKSARIVYWQEIPS